MADRNVKATLDMLAGLGLKVRVMRETPFLAVVENPAIPSRRVAVAVPDGDGPARAAIFDTDPHTGRNRPHGDSATVPRDDPWPTVAGMCRTWLTGLGALGDAAGLTRAELARRTGIAASRISEYARPRPGHADPGNMTLRTARILARALGVTIDALYDAMAMRIPENGPTVRQAGTSDPARRA